MKNKLPIVNKKITTELWNECLKGNGKPISEALEGWSEEDKMEMFYQTFVSRYSNITKEKWNQSNHKLKMFLYFDIFERVAKKNKFGRFWIRFFKLKDNY